MHRTHSAQVTTSHSPAQANVSIHDAVQWEQQSQRDWLAYENFMESLNPNPHPFLFPDKPSDADVLINCCNLLASAFALWVLWLWVSP